MVRIIFVFLFSVSLLSAFTQKDLKLRDGGIITFGGIDAKIVSFGGDATPECRLAISLDGRYFYLTKMHSSCRKFVNKKSQKIICNANKSVCKTRDELRAFVSGAPSGSSDSRTGIVSGLRAGGDGFLSVRTKPKGRKIGELYNGDKVAILGQRGAWYKVRTSSGLVGWSHGDWVRVSNEKKETIESKVTLAKQIIQNIALINEDNSKGSIDIYKEKCTKEDDLSNCVEYIIALEEGKIVKKDKVKAYSASEIFCQNGIKSCAIIGMTFIANKDTDEGIKLLNTGCKNGSNLSCNILGALYEEGKEGLKINKENAWSYFSTSCENNDSSSCGYMLILKLSNKDNTLKMTEDTKKVGINYIENECKLGKKLYCQLAAEFYNEGILGNNKDFNKGVKYLSKACDLGASEVCTRVGYIYYNGDKIRMQKNKAIPYFKKGCKADNKIACFFMGVMYTQSEGGLSQNLDKAKKYFGKACDLGDIDGCKNYKKIIEAIESNNKEQRENKQRRKSSLVGKYVCSTFSNGKNGWCGYITQDLSDSVRIENYKVRCGKGGFLGICTNINMGSCGGNVRLFVDEEYKNPKTLIVPKSCLD